MALSTYSDLTTAVANWTARADLTSRIPEFIKLAESDFNRTGQERPFKFIPARTYEEVSRSLLGDLVQKVFGGSRTQLLMRLFEEEKLSAPERKRLKEILDTTPKNDSERRT